MIQLGLLIDPIQTLNPAKDTSIALAMQAARRGYELYYFSDRDLWLAEGQVMARLSPLKIIHGASSWYEPQAPQIQPLTTLDGILLRKDPPFNMDYIYLTYLLELAAQQGVAIINDPASVRDANEKLSIAWFPECCPETLVSADMSVLQSFITDTQDTVIKPLNGMAGQSVFHVTATDPNRHVITENLTQQGRQFVMAQRFIPEISKGDKRIILINGEPIPYALARIPAAEDFRGNLAAGAQGKVQALSTRDLWICDKVGPILKEKKLWFVGIDVIGNYLTEINVTSPTGVQEIERSSPLCITDRFFDFIEAELLAPMHPSS